ncbi:MAG: zinc ribbon domain-containing protein [Gaiellaceae bacterium]
MARPSLLARFRRKDERVVAGARPTGPQRRTLPHPGQLRKERRALLRVREERLRDLGGLMLEMFRRDQFRQDLLVERCDELIALDERLQELDTLLAAAVSVRRAAPAARCACGAPLVWGSHFCANCGRPAAATPPVVGCPHCGSALAADAKFCVVCGKAVTPAQQSETGAVEPQPELLEALPTPAHERWEQ